ncbi:tRNA lysidine(34) synthetase TilS [Candidatus Gracilibacteria bacterium]|nr:tRNA lysidine(34) synthetase TilS [Candidatus Gracilibacteria bacterium]
MLNIQTFLEKYYNKDEKVILACSAGPDSMFLLYKILETNFRKNVVVCYFNHGTRPETDLEEKFLEELGKKEGFQVEVASCDFEKIQKLYPSKSFEELAREKRYQFFDAVLDIYKTDKVLLGHHLDDKIETFFFNLARGTKLTGLINMQECSSPSPQGEVRGGLVSGGGSGVLRPLLELEKTNILKYLDDNKLKYFIDSSNSENTYTRNKLRNTIIPKFGEVNSSYKKNIKNTINYFEQVKEFIDSEVKIFLEEQGILIFNSGKYKINTLSINGYFYIEDFNKKTDLLQKEIISHIFHISNGGSTIGLSEANIGDIIKFINGKNNKTIKEIKELKMRKENTIIIY